MDFSLNKPNLLHWWIIGILLFKRLLQDVTSHLKHSIFFSFVFLFFYKTCWYTWSGWRMNHYIVLKIAIMCWKLWSSSTCCMFQSHLNKLMPLYNKPVNDGCWSQTVGNWLLKNWVKFFAHLALSLLAFTLKISSLSTFPTTSLWMKPLNLRLQYYWGEVCWFSFVLPTIF